MRNLLRHLVAVAAVMLAAALGVVGAVWVEGRPTLARAVAAADYAFGPAGVAIGLLWCATLAVIAMRAGRRIDEARAVEELRLDDEMEHFGDVEEPTDPLLPDVEQVGLTADDITADSDPDISLTTEAVPVSRGVDPEVPIPFDPRFDQCLVPQPPGWACVRGQHPVGTPCASAETGLTRQRRLTAPFVPLESK